MEWNPLQLQLVLNCGGGDEFIYAGIFWNRYIIRTIISIKQILNYSGFFCLFFFQGKRNKLKGKESDQNNRQEQHVAGKEKYLATLINMEIIFPHSEESVTYVEVIPTPKIFSKPSP